MTATVDGPGLDVEMTDAYSHPVLVIDDGPATQRLTLRVTNTADRDVELRGLDAAPVSEKNHHVAIALRPGTLAPSAGPTIDVAGWGAARSEDGNTLYLGRHEPERIGGGKRIDLPIGGLNADRAGGAHGTRVEVSFSRVGFADGPGELTGSHLLVLDVVDERGRLDAPLEAGFVGGDRVLSDGTASTLTIRLDPVSRDTALHLAGSGAATPSEIVVSFPTQESGEPRGTALTRSGDAGSVALDVSGPDGAVWRQTRGDLGQSPVWTLVLDADTTLLPGSAIDITLRSIHALPAPGHASVFVGYRNVPGYQDGSFSLPVERSPLLFDATRVRIGQGPRSGAETARLTVRSDATQLQLYRPADAPGRGGQVFLELLQDEVLGSADFAYPTIRFNQHNTYWNRIEARPQGIMFKDGNPRVDNLTDVFAQTAVVDRLRVGGTHRIGTGPAGLLFTTEAGGPADVSVGTVIADRLRIGALPPGLGETAQAMVSAAGPGPGLQLRREKTAAGRGKQVFLELYQDDDVATADAYPTIRFHHRGNYWRRLEIRKDGFFFKEGDPESDDLVDVSARWANLSGGVRIGDVAFDTAAARILKKLVDGQLMFELVDTAHGDERLYAGGVTHDKERRYAFTYIPGGSQSPQGVWRLDSPR